MTGKVPKVLIVDDEPHIVDNLVQFFKLGGFETRSASSGRQAQRVLTQEPFDIVVSDVRMADGDGLELLKFCKARDFETPLILFITGQADLAPEAAYSAGAEALVAKPFDEEKLVELARFLLIPVAERWAQRATPSPASHYLQVLLPSWAEAIKKHRFEVGRGGVTLSIQGEPPHAGGSVELQIRFESGPPRTLEGRGIYRWVRTAKAGEIQVGIEVLSLAEEGRAWLLRHLAEFPTLAYLPGPS